jgi:hypothetical protein
MNGMRLMLIQDNHGSPGHWFWRCFQSLRAEFDRHHWLVPLQPWMGAPVGFAEGAWAIDFPGVGDTELMLWRAGAIGQWAERCSAESIDLMAVPLLEDPVALAAEFARVPWRAQDAWMADRAEFLLRYTDSASWDIYARRAQSLDAVNDSVRQESALRCTQAPLLTPVIG